MLGKWGNIMQQIFEKKKSIISDIINRFIDCMQIEQVWVYGDIKDELSDVYTATSLKVIDSLFLPSDSKLSYIRIDQISQFEAVRVWIREKREKQDFIIYSSSEEILKLIANEYEVNYYSLKDISSLQGGVFILGKTFDIPHKQEVPKDFKVLAIIHFYNEEDILEKTIKYLISQNIDIYLVDNWSSDRSYEIAVEAKKRYPKRICLERFPSSGKTDYYEWYNQLERTEEIQSELNYDWYIHYDADEMRVSPWEGCTLLEFLYRVDQLGYNLVDNTVLDHKITNKEDDIFMEDTFFDFGHKMTHFQQRKTWKRATNIDLKSSGGHIAQVEKPRIFPLKVLNRHYPLRSIEQAKRKVFIDRKLRFEKEKKERGWHGHYDKLLDVADLLCKEDGLLKWEKDTKKKLYIPLFTGCGIWKESKQPSFSIDVDMYKNKRVVIYGAGNWGKRLYIELCEKTNIVAWVDSKYKQYSMIMGNRIKAPDEINDKETDYIIIAVRNETSKKQIRELLIGNKIADSKIRYV